MREFLLELYLQHGEREFKCGVMGFELRVHGFLVSAVTTRITSKGLEYLKMRELLLELYLKYGERAIDFSEVEDPYVWDDLGALEIAKYIAWSPSALGKPECYITPKAIKYIKNLDNP